MKKFIFTVLASAMLLPTPILASEEMDEEVLMEDFEEMTLESSENEEGQEVLEAAKETTKKDTYNLILKDVDSNKTQKTLAIPTNASKATILKTLITSIPETYAFAKDPNTANLKEATEIGIQKMGSAIIENPEEDEENASLPLYFMCKTTSTIALKFESADYKDGLLTKATINDKLKEENISYTCNKNINTNNFNKVCYFEKGKLIPIALRNNIDNPYPLTKTNIDSEATIDLALSDTTKLTLELKYFNPKSDKITINASNLQKALNVYNEEEGLDWEYEVKSLTPATQTLSAYTAEFSPKNFQAFNVYAILPEDTSVKLEVENKSENGLFIIDNLTLKDLKVSHSALKDTEYGTITESNSSVKSYFTTNFNKLNYLSCNFKNKFAIEVDDKFNPTSMESKTIEGTIVASLTKLPEALYDHEYTLVFEDAANPGSVVSREKRTWTQFFKKEEVKDTLGGELINGFVPSGWKVAPIQKAGSKAKSKRSETATVLEAASLNSDGKKLSFSIFSSDELRVYVYGGKLPTTDEDKDSTTPAQTPSSQGRAVMYRVYNPKTHEHLYTKDVAERDKLIGEGWNDEGHGWISPAVSSYEVYRVYNPNSGEHHYTKDKNEYDTLVSYGWTGEGTAFFSADDADSKVTLYRLYHPNAPESAKHHYTMSEEERNEMIADGWIAEGTAWYGLPN